MPERGGALKALVFLLGGLLSGVLLGGLVLLSSPGRPGTVDRQLPPTVGSPLPDFDLPVLDGGRQKLSGLRGKPVLLNFWATWCPPCQAEMPLLDRYARKYAGRLVVLGLDDAEEDRVVKPFVTQLGIGFPILLDREGNLTDRYFVRNFPTTFFIDTDGILRAQHVGQLSEDLLVRYLKTIGIEP